MLKISQSDDLPMKPPEFCWQQRGWEEQLLPEIPIMGIWLLVDDTISLVLYDDYQNQEIYQVKLTGTSVPSRRTESKPKEPELVEGPS